MSSDLRKFLESSPLFGNNGAYIEAYYEDFLRDPESVDPQWRDYFRSLNGKGQPHDVAHSPIRESFARLARQAPAAAAASGMAPEAAEKQAAVLRLINAYRVRGHQVANLDPLGLYTAPRIQDLEPSFHGLGERDMDAVFNSGSLAAEQNMPLREILRLLRETYTGTVGAEYMYITDTQQKRWIQRRLEGGLPKHALQQEERIHLLKELTAAEGIERYLHTRYVGQKRFSLEGADVMIPLLDDVVRRSAAQHNVEEVVIGMAHRGRLNVLVNLLGKSPAELFREFDGDYSPENTEGSGDVKYHLGFSTDVDVDEHRVHLVLAFNPSHLEIVDPVVEGSVRARQHRRGDALGESVLPVLIHGDAAFAGQGVVMETLQLTHAKGYATGGTVHVIVNNQVGFTTSNPLENNEIDSFARTSRYCTDIAKMLEVPVFHVNADDPEAVIFVTRMALDYRAEFKRDVLIDLVSYRRHGHNEADEPAVTQPLMYQKIRAQDTVRALYGSRLAELGVVSESEVKDFVDQYRAGLDEGRNIELTTLGMIGNEFTADWEPYKNNDWDIPTQTGVPVETIKRVTQELLDLPEAFELHPRVKRIMGDRGKMAAGALPLDWGFAETMAYASLLEDGYSVRIAGQDSGRGTFFHRHAVIYNQQNGDSHIPLTKLKESRGDFDVNDTLLSEEGVLGFEYGYSTAEPNALVVWEAQFGDFANGAQVVIDQFIASGQAKWGRLCGLTMFLPHGYEGQGPEHSSARLERYLQLCAENNQQVCVPSTPAQMFHMLRRQMLRPFRRPLIVMTPKSLLRHRLSVSTLEDLADGEFQPIIDEIDDLAPKKVKRVVFCSGKVFFDLYKARQDQGIDDVALVRIEQLYPFPLERYEAILDKYSGAQEIVWCQEEPENQGAWYQIKHRLQAPLKSKHTLLQATRAGAASTAVGYHKLHAQQQQEVVENGLTGGKVHAG